MFVTKPTQNKNLNEFRAPRERERQLLLDGIGVVPDEHGDLAVITGTASERASPSLDKVVVLEQLASEPPNAEIRRVVQSRGHPELCTHVVRLFVLREVEMRDGTQPRLRARRGTPHRVLQEAAARQNWNMEEI